MLVQFWSISSSTTLNNSWGSNQSGKHQFLIPKRPIFLRKPRACLGAQLPDEISQLAHNKVLIAAGVCAAIGQLTKPIASVILYGKEFDFRTVVQAGGFPSTHSSAVVATATTLALERGLSDSIFGLTVVYAGIVMYDAQGVRREAGRHAKVLNKMLPANANLNSVAATKDIGRINSQAKASPSSLKLPEEAKSFSSIPTNGPLVSESNNKMRQATTQMQMSSDLGTNAEEVLESATSGSTPLKESIGHTEVEVTAGAVLGFLVGLVVYATM